MTKRNATPGPVSGRRRSTSMWCGSPRRYRLRSGEREPIRAAYIGKKQKFRTRIIKQSTSPSPSFRPSPSPSSSSSSEPAGLEDDVDGQSDPDVPMDDQYESESSRTAVGQEFEVSDSIFTPEVFEVPETCDLEVHGELLLEDDSTDSIPIRALSDFAIYELNTRQLVSFNVFSYGNVPSGIGASGVVAAWIDDGEDLGVVEGNEDLYVALTEILEVNINYVNDGAGHRDELDNKVYIRTLYAWYILDVPSALYTPFFAEFWIKHYLFHQVVLSSLEDSELDYSKFTNILHEVSEEEAEKVIGRGLILSDFTAKDTCSFIAASLEELCDESEDFCRLLEDVPLVKQLNGGKALGSGTQSKPSQKTKPTFGDKSKTIVTYRVEQYACSLFKQDMQRVGDIPSDANQHPAAPPATFVHPTNHTDIHWDLDSCVGLRHYQSVIIDGVQYKIGDAVIIEPGQDTNDSRNEASKEKESRSLNPLANTKWFAKICYFFEEKGKKYFHAQWYQHGSQILLQETAHSQSLFLINECDDLDLNCIYQKCNLRVLEPSDEEPLPNLDFEDNDFCTGLTWDPKDACFMEVTPEEHDTAIKACVPRKPCYPCGIQKLEELAAQWTPLPDGGMSHLNVAYHSHDFVYLRPAQSKHGLYTLAQIIEFYEDEDEWYAHFRLFARYSLLVKSSSEYGVADDVCHLLMLIVQIAHTSQRRLYMTSKVLCCRPLTDIDGKCFVVHSALLSASQLEDWVKHDDHFYADLLCDATDPKSLEQLSPLPMMVLKTCEECMEQHSTAIEETSTLLKKHGPLKGLELFAGAGGLSTGFNATGFVKTEWAVEYNPEIAFTYQANHPDTIVYNQCSNALLKHAVQTLEGKHPEPLETRRKDDPKKLPPLPRPGMVDFIYGGPPCQSFSGMNHNKREDDPRSTMPCNMLSYVEFYRPQYFLLENVRGMVHFKLAKQLKDDEDIGAAVRFGIIKFILRALVGLGYQSRFKVLQAGQYGAPQGRQRVIFWGAKRDVPLPKFPLPTHLFEPSSYFWLPTRDKLRPSTRTTWLPDEDEPIHHQCAPMPPVTAMDAISDLPQFDWINPHQVIEKISRDYREVQVRISQGIAQCHAVRDGPYYAGFEKPVAYAKKPLNRYQLFMREKMKSNEKVKYHYSSRFSALSVERVVNVPIKPRSNHMDLPPELLMQKRNGGGYDKAGYNSLFMRVDGNAHFNTALTTVNPARKGGSVIHPTQKRVLTVRECARIQGFPDHYQFLSLNKTNSGRLADQLRQIGNAVPIPLGIALGKELGKVLVQMWKKRDQDAEMERDASPEVEMYGSEEY